jgi:hypothetical protein
MKINFHKDPNERWVNTICVQCSQLNKITNKSRWDEIVYDQSTLNSIRTKAIKEYEKDGNKYGDVQFNVIHNEFPDIRMLKDRNLLLNFIIRFAKDNEETNYIASKFNRR